MRSSDECYVKQHAANACAVQDHEDGSDGDDDDDDDDEMQNWGH